VRDPRRPANGISQAFSALLACFGGSQYGAIHSLAGTRPARGDSSRRLHAASPELRSAAAQRQSARLDKSGLSGRLSLKSTSRATRRRPRERTRATGCLLEHAAEFAHRLHPIRSIEPQPVEDRSQAIRDCQTSGGRILRPSCDVSGVPARRRERTRVLYLAGRIAVSMFPSGRDEPWVSAFLLRSLHCVHKKTHSHGIPAE
jgi:hypothetical protein